MPIDNERVDIMQKSVTEYMKAFANAYIILIAAVLPLYMQDGLVMIGDAKYSFFLRVAVVISAISVLGCGVLFLDRCRKPVNLRITSSNWSVTDCFVLFYVLSTVVSYCFSDYKQVALFGYMDWHMGLLTQLLLVWSYFFVSRFYSGEKIIWKIIGVALFGVTLVGVLNRYVYDPLGVFQEIGREEWNRLNLLSTIGNINWYSGYLCLTLPLTIYLFWSGKKIGRMVGALGTFIGFLSLFTQGSASGYVGCIGSLLVLCFFSLTEQKHLQHFLQVMMMMAFVPLFIEGSIYIAPRGLQLPDEEVVRWNGWVGVCLFFILLYVIVSLWKKCDDCLKSGKIQKIFGIAVCVGFFILLMIIVLCQWVEPIWELLGSKSILKIDEEWGSGRGGLWMASMECFAKSDWKQRLIGAGPDCFACVVYEMVDMNAKMQVSGQWDGAIFANAHNEWLNMLITGGILGMVSYLGIYISAVKRFWSRVKEQPIMLLGIMAVAGYGLHNIFSFQQIISTPIMFIILGMMENHCRNHEKNELKEENKSNG
uniref:O-antigen ligase family protein n=1 Tax=Acetatifactor sp. TaxID=1872090 RepID=UPI004055F7C5